MTSFVPLWVKSNYSFLEGASHPEELVEQAHRLGLPALALTDRDGVYGVVRAHVRAKELGLKLLIGSQISVRCVGRKNRDSMPVVLLAQDREGYGNLCRLISKGRLRGQKGSSLVELGEVCEATTGLIALCNEIDFLGSLKSSFKNRLYVFLGRHYQDVDRNHEEELRWAAAYWELKTVACTEILYHASTRQPLHDVLTCIRHGVTLSQAGDTIRSNTEHDIKTPLMMRELYADDLASLQTSLEIASQCNFSLDQLRYRYPEERRPAGVDESSWLRQLTYEGAKHRYPKGIPNDVCDQIERELVLIQELDYGGYFLTMYEVVQFCKESSILCQGRGSAANSAICYALGITAIDPVNLELLFERFLSRERAEPPDIDLDIEHERREEVIQWMYERYGRKHAAMVANIIRYRTKSAIRDVGKALGIQETALDRLSKMMGSRFVSFQDDALTQAGLNPSVPVCRHLLSLVDEIRDFPRHLSIHPGGFLLGHEPVDSIVPIENATMEGRTVVQWDKYSIEDLNLFKVDLLGLGALTQCRKCFDLLRKHRGVDLQLNQLPQDDPSTFKMMTEGKTVGVFQVESRAQMSMLPRLKPKNFYDLVVEVAIVRPGPIQGNMVHPYLRRRNHEEELEYPHEDLKTALKKTLGVPIFQEQVMKIAMLVGGYSGGEADQLRKDMGAWKSSGRIERHYQVLTQRMIQNGIEPEFAERIFNQIRGFGEYGFPESHAASFALVAYATAWLKCHYPEFFVCALLNAQPMGFYAPATIVEDAKRSGVMVRPVDVNRSEWDCTLESLDNDRFALRMGFRYVKGLGEREKQAFQAASKPFVSIEDFVRKTEWSSQAAGKAAQAGAFEALEGSRRNAVWVSRGLSAEKGDTLVIPKRAVANLPPAFAQLDAGDDILWDYRTSEHSTRGHPMATVRSELMRQKMPTAEMLNRMKDGQTTRYVGMAICRQQPGTATGVTFYTLEDETGFVNVVVWQSVFQRHSVLARTALILGVQGRVQSESGVIHLIADRLWEPALDFCPEGATTRSFH